MLIHTEYIPVGIPLQIWRVADEPEALQIVGDFPAYLFQSKTIDALYVCVPVTGSLAPRAAGQKAG